MKPPRLVLINATLISLMVGNAEAAANIKVAVAANFNEPAREIAVSFRLDDRS